MRGAQFFVVRPSLGILRAIFLALFILQYGPVSADPFDPASVGSLGPSPFTSPGVYTIDTTSTPPILTGPGTGVIGLYTVDANSVAIFSFDSISIGSGVTIRATGSRPVVLLSLSSFDVMSGGVIDASGTYVAGTGYVPGAGGGNGGMSQGAGPGGGMGSGTGGGGGGGFGAPGGNGGGTGGGAGGITYGNLATLLQGGSGGGGSVPAGISGAAAGGAVEIGASGTVTIGGTVNANGAPGGAAAGGGSAGGVLIHGQSVTLSGAIYAMGGNGGDAVGFAGGGGGGAGRVHVLTAPGGFSTVSGFVVAMTGGNGGAPDGSLGGSSAMVVDVLPPPVANTIAGCIKVSGAPLTGASVKLKQQSLHLQTLTDSQGCYEFPSGLTNHSGTITIELPAVQ